MKNKYTGIRKYQVDFSKSTRQMGSYHFLDGEVVRVFYRGNSETCGRCHQVARNCPGRGKKKECKELGGKFLHISEHMKELWDAIDFVPTGFELPAVEADSEENLASGGDVSILETKTFKNFAEKPVPTEQDLQKYQGINISNFPPHLSETDIFTFLIEKGLPKDLNMNSIHLLKTDKNIKILINDSLDWETVQTLTKSIHFHDSHQMFWDTPLFCKPIRQLTPMKPAAVPVPLQDQAEKAGEVQQEIK